MSFNKDRFKAFNDKMKADAIEKMKKRSADMDDGQDYTAPVDTKKKIKVSGKSRIL